jgi:hypothetical protein
VSSKQNSELPKVKVVVALVAVEVEEGVLL